MGRKHQPNVGKVYKGEVEGCQIEGHFKDCNFTELGMYDVTVAGTFDNCNFETANASIAREEVTWSGKFVNGCRGVGE